MPSVAVTVHTARLASASPIDTGWHGVLGQVATGQPVTVTPGSASFDLGGDWTLVVGGTGLAVGPDGRLAAGTVEQITLLASDGTVLAQWVSADPGGLGLEVAALRQALASPAAMDALLASWTYAYSAESVTDGIGYPVAFEAGRNADTLRGGAGADSLRGAGGDDLVLGGGGDDAIRGDATLLGPAGAVAGNDRLDGGGGDDEIWGDGGDDEIRGGSGHDTLWGDNGDEAGDDAIWGGAGDDLITGGLGDDLLVGGDGVDTLAAQVRPDDGTVFVANLATGVSTGHGTDAIRGFENVRGSQWQRNDLTGDGRANGLLGGALADVLRGGGGADSLEGGGGDDQLRGGGGADVLGGGDGQDRLWGGAGADAFVFRQAGAAHADRVEDFGAGDRLVLTGGLLDPEGGLWGQGPVDAAVFKDLSTGAQDADDRILYDRATGELWLDRDGLGDMAPELICRLAPGTALGASQVWLDWAA